MRKRNILVSLAIALIALSAYALTPPAPVTSYSTGFGVEIHVELFHYDPYGNLIFYSHHAGVLTNIGADFIEQQISGSASTTVAVYIGLSNDATAPQASWETIPTEISTNGMGRATGSYTDDGTGQWNVTKTFSPTGSGSCQLTGLYYAATGDFLLCADQFSSQVNYDDGDSLEVRWSLSVTGT